MTDESGQTYPMTVDRLLDRAVGAEGYYGAYTVNAHTDTVDSDVSTAVVNSALARNVPIVSARQMLTWLDARGNSSFGALSFASGVARLHGHQGPGGQRPAGHAAHALGRDACSAA